MVAILFSRETGILVCSFHQSPHLEAVPGMRYQQRHKRIPVGATGEMERDRFLQPDPSSFTSSHWVYKFHSPHTAEGEKHDYHIIQSLATWTSAQYTFSLYELTFNILFLNRNVKFCMIKDLFTLALLA